jgi:hypothetical protein
MAVNVGTEAGIQTFIVTLLGINYFHNLGEIIIITVLLLYDTKVM